MCALKVKVISWPWPKVIYIWKLKLAFLRNDWAILSQILFCAWPKYQVSVSQDHWSSGYHCYYSSSRYECVCKIRWNFITDFPIYEETLSMQIKNYKGEQLSQNWSLALKFIWICMQNFIKFRQWLFKILRKQNVKYTHTDGRTTWKHYTHPRTQFAGINMLAPGRSNSAI